MLTRRSALALSFAALAAPAMAEAPKMPVVASFSIIGDLVREVGGDRVDVSPPSSVPNGDAHVYQPTPADGRKLARARLIFVNGLGFEGWIDRLVAAVENQGASCHGQRKASRRAQRTEGHDPHAWQDVANAKVYVENIRDALDGRRSRGAPTLYQANADRLSRQARRARRGDPAAIAAIPPGASTNRFDP